jgi:hypothetical protein
VAVAIDRRRKKKVVFVIIEIVVDVAHVRSAITFDARSFKSLAGRQPQQR